MHYVTVIDKDPGSAYGVRFPEVPGCYSAADSFDDIVPNAIEALSLFFEDGEATPPRGIEAVCEEVAGSLAEGAVLMMIPYVRDRKRVRGGRIVQRYVLYLGEINDTQRAAWCRAIEVVEGKSGS